VMKILVTGANGQLGNCIRDAAQQHPELDFHFTDKGKIDIDDANSVEHFFKNNKFDYCINTAAYTNVEKAESHKKEAFLTNAEGAKHIAQACSKNDTVLIHVSTDYVFDGKKKTPYTENDEVNPINVYGASKLKGEQYIREICDKFFIFRTSWLYSQYGRNFLNSMLRFANEQRDLSITTEQIGTPTNANDLAGAIIATIVSHNEKYGVYHFSNKGSATWYDFAKAIFSFSEQLENLKLEKTKHYRTFAERPSYSILDKTKFADNFTYPLVDWQDSLKKIIENHK
jgi:dTDP-4-dehydrorhamnose reductase